MTRRPETGEQSWPAPAQLVLGWGPAARARPGHRAGRRPHGEDRAVAVDVDDPHAGAAGQTFNTVAADTVAAQRDHVAHDGGHQRRHHHGDAPAADHHHPPRTPVPSNLDSSGADQTSTTRPKIVSGIRTASSTPAQTTPDAGAGPTDRRRTGRPRKPDCGPDWPHGHEPTGR